MALISNKTLLFCFLLSPNMDQALRRQQWSIEEENRGVWMWSTKYTPILSFEFNGHKKREKKYYKSKSIWKKWHEQQTSGWHMLRRVKCVLAFFSFFFFLFVFFPLCCYLNAWTENETLPITVLKLTIQCVVFNQAHTGTFAKCTCIKAVVLLTHALFVNTSVCLYVLIQHCTGRNSKWHINY